MGIVDFSLYNNFPSAVLVFDGGGKIVFKNIHFVKTFGKIKSLEKFSNNFSFDICVLDSDDLLRSNPIRYALDSKENFGASATYQKADKLIYFEITAFFVGEFKVLSFKNTTTELLYYESEKKYSFIRQQYLSLVEENRKYANLQNQSQAQAVKLGLLNRISNVIRESIDLNKIINSALKELYNLFGAVKVYYVSVENEVFAVRHVYPEMYKSIIGDVVEFSSDTKKNISARKIKTSACIKEFLNSEINFPAQVTRVIVPVARMHEIQGVLIIYTSRNYFDESQNDVLYSISSQLASAIVQASLFSQVKQKNEELENALKELKETQLQLINSEKMASLGQLVAGVAHEINTPLASIKANNEILQKLINKFSSDISEDVAKKIYMNIENITAIDKEAIKRISGIVQGLKKFVRLDESDLQLADINKELDLTLELIKHETKNKIKITRDYSNLPQIKCYPNMLNQVFMNILINACQSMPNGGDIHITTAFEQDSLIVKIKDTGCGIDEKIKDKMFIAGTTTKQIGIGTGLGLAISKKIVEKHNGDISFVSETGKGTEFIIKIPVVID